ncbi:RNA methyltransferase [Paenibacillus rigui]|uniref:RNA methyltransferase n=2 Tax=Paenibacillus rigui TaxID=554312 RepID=A0A229UPK5_9BACL|nr:RNA methyltransferase [Paenibacillus rigui]
MDLDHHLCYLYTWTAHEEELSLCKLELKVLLGCIPEERIVASERRIDPSRSPFVKHRLDVLLEGEDLPELSRQVAEMELEEGATFKVVFLDSDGSVDYAEARAIERVLGLHIRGKAEMRRPDRLFGVARTHGRWRFGACHGSEAVWLRHQAKPQHYSTALSTRVARAVANIAVPEPAGVRAIDPCCGIGTVLIEALSMGVDIVGYDINPLAVRGARANLAHFGFPDVAAIGDIRQLGGAYDTAILDMPYNLCSKLPPDEQLAMLASARRLASRAVIVTTEDIDAMLQRVGFRITDRCVVRKGAFARHILVCT